MRPLNFDINDTIELLMGSCDTLSLVLPENMHINDLTAVDYNAIDNEIFECTECGWWCELSELSESNDNICQSCYEA